MHIRFHLRGFAPGPYPESETLAAPGGFPWKSLSPGRRGPRGGGAHAYLPHTCNPWRDAGADARGTALRSARAPALGSPGKLESSLRLGLLQGPKLRLPLLQLANSAAVAPPPAAPAAAPAGGGGKRLRPSLPAPCASAAVRPLPFPGPPRPAPGSHLQLLPALPRPGRLLEKPRLTRSLPDAAWRARGSSAIGEAAARAWTHPPPPSLPPPRRFPARCSVRGSAAPRYPPQDLPPAPPSFLGPASPPPQWVSRPQGRPSTLIGAGEG